MKLNARCFYNYQWLEVKPRLFKVTYIIDHQVHDGLWDQVTDTLVDDGHVGVHEVADGLHLPL